MTSEVKGIETVNITSHTSEHIFNSSEFEYLEDPSGKLTFNEISSNKFAVRFHQNTLNYPLNKNASSVYWFRMKVHYDYSTAQNYLLEFYNHGLEELTVYVPDDKGNYNTVHTGAKYAFEKRLFSHKNFEFWLPPVSNDSRTYYFSVKSSNAINIVVAHKTLSRFIQYALTEYMFFGLFYGLILLFSFYNLIMYLVIRERHYLYYILYLLAVGLYEISTDGIAFQYLWPDSPSWNKYAFGNWLFLISIFALLFAANFLQLKIKANKLYKLVIAVIVLRTCYYLLCLFGHNEWFNYSIIELIPLTLAFASGIYGKKDTHLHVSLF